VIGLNGKKKSMGGSAIVLPWLLKWEGGGDSKGGARTRENTKNDRESDLDHFRGRLNGKGFKKNGGMGD